MLLAMARAGLEACTAQDIYRKSSLRRAKYLFSFPGRVGLLAAGGKIGQLVGLDTPTPSLYVDFPAVSRLLRLRTARSSPLLPHQPTHPLVAPHRHPYRRAAPSWKAR